MAEREHLQKQYGYHAMSNKVEQVDRSKLRSSGGGGGLNIGGPTGEVESLARRSDIGRMGDRIVRSSVSSRKDGAATESTKKRRSSVEAASNSKKKQKSSSVSFFAASGGGTTSVWNDDQELDHYRPTTENARDAYERILTFVSSADQNWVISNQGPAVLKDAVQEIIVLLKDESIRDPERQDMISFLLTGKKNNTTKGLSSNSSKTSTTMPTLTADQFNKLVQWGKQLDDYNDRNASVANSNSAGTSGGEMDAVAVVFDDEDDGDESDGGRHRNSNNSSNNKKIHDDSDVDEDVVVDTSSSDDDNGASDNDGENQDKYATLVGSDADRQNIVNKRFKKNKGREKGAIDDSENDSDTYDDHEDKPQLLAPDKVSKGKYSKNDRELSVHEIDAHFVQRQLSNYYNDADVSALKAAEVLDVLSNINDDARGCENKLLVLLGFDLFDVIRLFQKNRLKIWAVVSRKRAQSESQRQAIDAMLLQHPLGRAVYDEIHNNSNNNININSKNNMNNSNKTTAFNNDQSTSNTDRKDLKTTKVKTEDFSKALDSIGLQNKHQQQQSTVGNDGGDGATSQKESIQEGDNIKLESATELDLDFLAFKDGALLNNVKKCTLPDTSWRAMKKGYEEVHVPAVRRTSSSSENAELVHIQNDLPSWTHPAFKGMDTLNHVQSKLCPVALTTSENILLCAPTGAGKTNVACLTMLNIMGQYRINNDNDLNSEGFYSNIDEDGDRKTTTGIGKFDLQAFKIVYVAPMKALVQEVVKNFSERLSDYGISVRELSGDSSLSRQEISETHVIVTTPEKWDIVTRQGDGRAYTQLVRLIIIDEIHLLHDERGPVLESIIARSIRQVETTSEPIRLVGLSATLPNYQDVGALLRVKPDVGLFFFDHSYRPVPLQMQYIGITERSALKRFQLQNEICYEKAMDQRRYSNQVLIFVHSRAETAKAAKALRDIAMERDELSPYFVKDGSATQEILREEAGTVKNADLKDVLPHGFAIHHAGMAREDRELVEDLFADRHIAVLCCTATLAWGVNLPAHAVIIRGTQIYDPAKGRWSELSPLDIMQMLGRAGRPQYDSEGEGIIITNHSQLQYYLSLINIQLPVESQLIKTLPNHLNAEVVLGSVQSIKEAVDWLGYTFLSVRMLHNPTLYGISEEALRDDPTLKQRRLDLAHTAASILEKCHLIRYDRKSGSIQPTPLGRVASQFYITHSSMAIYTRNMRPNLSDIELLRLFALSGEFAHITVREEEKLELVKLSDRVPIPVKESPSEPSAKINMLLQAYISRLKLEGFALIADMAFIQQSAARIMRALFEISLKKNWSSLAKLCLDMSNMISHRIWRSQSPLRQYKNVPDIVCRKLERKNDIDWTRYSDLTPSDLGELVGVPKMGRVLHKLVQQFPRVVLTAQIQPITRSMLRIELSVVPAFHYDVTVHGYSQMFHVIVEDVNGEMILHHETLFVKSRGNEEGHTLIFTVPILEPLPPAYFVRIISDRWLHSTAVLPISFSTMILPAKFPPPTELLDLQPILPSVLGERVLTKIFPFKEFNPIQTQTFHELFKTDKNCLVCAPSNSGKTICGVLAILRMLTTDPNGKCVYVAPTDDIADPVYKQFTTLLGSMLPKGSIGRLKGDPTPDLEILQKSKVVVSSVKHWDMISRRWKQRKTVQTVTLMIFDELHFLGGELGPPMEIVISRTRFMSNQLHNSNTTEGNIGAIRIIGLSAPIANAKDIGEWMGVSSKSLFNFSPKARTLPLEMYFLSFDQNSNSARLMAMAKPVFTAISRHWNGRSVLVYVPSKRQAQLTAIDIMTFAESQGFGSFIGSNGSTETDVAAAADQLREPALSQVVKAGIGFVHSGMIGTDFDAIVNLYTSGSIRVLVCPADLCWKLQCIAHLVIIMGTESYDGRESKHVDYPIVDILHMIGRHETSEISKCVLMCHSPKKEYLKKLIYDPLPIESHLDSYLHDPLNSEIVTKTVSSMQDAIDYLTWTFLYRRLSKNPTYYGLRGTTNIFVSEYLSEMIETVVGDLDESKCCTLSDDGTLSPLNLGMIAAYYYVQYRTIELVAASVTAKKKIRDVLEILSAAWEFSTLPIRFGEDKTMKIMSRNLVHKLPESAMYDSNTKALMLLQYHFSRIPVVPAMRPDQRFVIKEAITLLQAIVDVVSSSGWLKPALAAMELSQMVVQGLWSKDHVLKQIPHFTDEIIHRCQAYVSPNGDDDKIEGVFDILSLDDDIRNELLQLPDDKMSDVAIFCNRYPNIDVSFQVLDPDDVTAGEPVRIVVDLQREIDEDEEMTEEELSSLGIVAAALFPSEKNESWWVVIGDSSKNTLLSLKRTNFRLKQKVTLDFLAPEDPGDYDLTLFFMSDSYLGCDQEYSIPLSVVVADDEDDESSHDGEDIAVQNINEN